MSWIQQKSFGQLQSNPRCLHQIVTFVSGELSHRRSCYQRSPLFDEKDKMAILYAERVTRGAAGVREGSVEELKKHFTEVQIVELTLVICVANFTNRFNDALQPVPDLGV